MVYIVHCRAPIEGKAFMLWQWYSVLRLLATCENLDSATPRTRDNCFNSGHRHLYADCSIMSYIESRSPWTADMAVCKFNCGEAVQLVLPHTSGWGGYRPMALLFQSIRLRWECRL